MVFVMVNIIIALTYNPLADINEDGIVDIIDIVALVNIIFETVYADGILFCTSDMNLNNIININDIVLVVEKILGN